MCEFIRVRMTVPVKWCEDVIRNHCKHAFRPPSFVLNKFSATVCTVTEDSLDKYEQEERNSVYKSWKMLFVLLISTRELARSAFCSHLSMGPLCKTLLSLIQMICPENNSLMHLTSDWIRWKQYFSPAFYGSCKLSFPFYPPITTGRTPSAITHGNRFYPGA